MKRLLSFIMCSIIIMSLFSTNAMALSGVTWSKNITLTNKVNKYTDVVIGAGVNVHLSKSTDPKEPNGLWVTKSITFNSGSSLTGDGILILDKGVTVKGKLLYYVVGGKLKPFKDGISTLWKSGIVADGENASFRFDSKTGAWKFTNEFEVDPFYRDNENNQPPVNNNNDQNLNEANLDGSKKVAAKLNYLGLVKGNSVNKDGSVNYDVQRQATRLEALTMLIRYIGKETEAKSGNFNCPFTDVPDWAKPYVGYAFEHNLTKGVSETKFGSSNADANTYLTFILRALNYEDGAGKDFTWDKATEFAKKLNILSNNVSTTNFLRADMFIVSDSALNATVKGTDIPLFEKLISDGVFTREQYFEAMKFMQ